MPVFEMQCAKCGEVEDCYLSRWNLPNPVCPRCGGERQRLMSRFASPYSGSIHKYTELGRENSHIDGWWAYRKVSSISGQPEPVYIDSMAALKAFNKAEGLAQPGEVPTHSTVSADGRRIISDGMPGQWRGSMPSIPARLQEIIDLPQSALKPAPATVTPRMPLDYGIRPQVAVFDEKTEKHLVSESQEQ